nr:MAG TPA: hypothetical protein [Caudoviricetes sp.]
MYTIYANIQFKYTFLETKCQLFFRRYIMEEEMVIKENAIIRIYSVEEWKEYFNGKEYVSIEELINVNLMQFLMQRQNKVIKNEGKIDRIEEYGIV